MEKIIDYSKKIILEKKGSFDVCIDATCGNGFDTFFLGSHFKKVYAFDIQEVAINNTKARCHKLNNIIYILDNFKNYQNYQIQDIDCVMFNLGYLPSGNKDIHTNPIEVIQTLNKLISEVRKNCIISIITYPGFESGLYENEVIFNYLKTLNQKEVTILKYEFINQINNPPIGYFIRKE